MKFVIIATAIALSLASTSAFATSIRKPIENCGEAIDFVSESGAILGQAQERMNALYKSSVNRQELIDGEKEVAVQTERSIRAIDLAKSLCK